MKCRAIDKVRKERHGFNMKKRILLSFLAVILTVSVCACGKKQEEAKEENTTEESTEEAAESSENITVDASEYVTLPQYKGIEVSIPMVSVMDEDISDYITENMLTSYEVTDRAVQLGDIVNIDYIGKDNGVAFDGGTAEGYDLTIGSGQFIDGFEEGLIGAATGEILDLNLTFPENYHADLAGKDVVFTVTVNAIKAKTDYESLTVEQLISMNIGFETKEDLWEAGKKAYEEKLEENRKIDIQNALYDKLMAETSFAELPQDLVDAKIADYNDYMRNMCQQYYGCTLEDYITSTNKTQEQYDAEVKQMMEDNVKEELLIDAIAQAESIEVSEEDILQKAQELAEQYQYPSAEELLKTVGEEEFRRILVRENTVTFLRENAVVTEE